MLVLSACTTTRSPGWYARQVEQGKALEVPYVQQASPTDCGVAALASVMQYYQGPVHAQRALIERHPPASPEGYSLGELRDIARAHDFAAFVIPADESFLRRQLNRSRPLIVPLQLQGAVARLVGPEGDRGPGAGYDHFVVVVGLDDERRKVITMDPARGPVELGLDDFAARWEKLNHAVLLVGLAAEPD